MICLNNADPSAGANKTLAPVSKGAEILGNRYITFAGV
jgi:hypothetical protein